VSVAHAPFSRHVVPVGQSPGRQSITPDAISVDAQSVGPLGDALVVDATRAELST
jgi:hypothetical protein